MANIRRMRVGSSAEEVECRDELITDILSRVSTRDLLKMSTVRKRWRTLIFDPFFIHTHYRNCPRESLLYSVGGLFNGEEMEEDQLRSLNPQTGNLSTFSASFLGLDISFKNETFDLVTAAKRNETFDLVTASNGLLCFLFMDLVMDLEEILVYNPVTKFSKKIRTPLVQERMDSPLLIGFCTMQNTRKLILGGFYLFKEDTYTLVFDSQSNSWYKGPPLFRHVQLRHPPPKCYGRPLSFNGVIYFLITTPSIDAQEGTEPRDAEALFRDDKGIFYMIIGYDVNEDKWCFSMFITATIGYPYCLIEWEGNLLICASNSTHEENVLVLAASSTHDRNQRIKYSRDEGDGHFVFWILDTEHKLWTRERELDISHVFHTSWNVSASGGVVWLESGCNSVTVYHMKDRHYSTHRLYDEDGLAWRQRERIFSFVSFEPTLLSF